MKIMVTGGAGFIGSHIVNEYINAGHDVVIIDDLSSGEMRFVNPKAMFYQLNIHSPDVKIILEKEKISAINHHAAQISVTESVSDPLFDANSNIIGTLQLLQNAVSLKIVKFVFIFIQYNFELFLMLYGLYLLYIFLRGKNQMCCIYYF